MKRAEQFIKNFQEQVACLKQKRLTPSTLALKGIYLSKRTLTQLKKWNEEKEFEAVTDEVHFFKNLKPVPMSYLIFFTEMRMCELRKPKAGLQFQTSFFKKELKTINKFFYRYSEFSNYMETEQSYLDQQFFSKTPHATELIRPLINYTQFSEFETSHDLLWAKIKAMHKLIDYIKHALENLHKEKFPIEGEQAYNLKWTASKVAMTELVYALYSAQAVNSGKADLKEIAGAFQNIFQIDLGDLYHTYGEIRARKMEHTKFIDHLKIALQQRMYEADE
ncbi:RteC domain-containing protein [Mesonia maritima]|uniref:RteC protein n=1 Tax=Mesonia maritima TaxID=1793873 RepID=A0ABU1KBG7_9FLAO|nr:RteC domain-containing protein [Mesonia maritima]MDR6301817.1 hypothetical protein [Mesonia maritima]